MITLSHPSRWVLPIERRSIVAGILSAAVLVGAYLTIIALAQGVEHAFDQLAADALFVGFVALGFGVQIALFRELRAADRHHRASTALTTASTGTSAAAMLACCAHHVVDLLPLVGFSAAAVFLNAYKTPIFLVGIGMNILGVVVIGYQLRNAHRACAMDAQTPSVQPVVAPGGAS